MKGHVPWDQKGQCSKYNHGQHAVAQQTAAAVEGKRLLVRPLYTAQAADDAPHEDGPHYAPAQDHSKMQLACLQQSHSHQEINMQSCLR